MRIILLNDIKGTGKKFEEKEVSDGYALNFLIPKHLALIKDKMGMAKVNLLKAQSEKKKAEENRRMQEKLAKRLEKSQELEKFKQKQHS